MGSTTQGHKVLLSGIIADEMSMHMAHYLSWTQMGIGCNIREAKHQLLIDRTVTQEWWVSPQVQLPETVQLTEAGKAGG